MREVLVLHLIEFNLLFKGILQILDVTVSLLYTPLVSYQVKSQKLHPSSSIFFLPLISCLKLSFSGTFHHASRVSKNTQCFESTYTILVLMLNVKVIINACIKYHPKLKIQSLKAQFFRPGLTLRNRVCGNLLTWNRHIFNTYSYISIIHLMFINHCVRQISSDKAPLIVQ